MANNQIKIGVGFQVDKSGLNDLISSLRQIQHNASVADPTGKLKTGLNESAKAAEKLENILNKSWNNKLNQLDLSRVSQGIKETYGSVSKMKTELEKSGAVGINAYNHMASAILNTNLQLKQSNKLLDDMATSMANTVKWGITSSIFNNITNSISQAYSYTKRLDSSLNDIRIVTDKSAESMEKFARQANNAAKNLGASTLDYTEASLIYYQQGLGEEDVAARAETTLKAANVTGQYAEEVSEQLTAVWNGYKVSAQEAELYVDKLAAVAATTAADLEELSTGMSKVASAANSMGVDVDQLNAQLATIVSVTRQAPESVGTALKTIYARMSDLKVGGIDEEGLGLGDVSGTMSSMGIQVLDASGNLREMGDVIEEVASKWDTWTEAQKTAMAQVMAGKRQYNNLVALFENWDMYTDALNESTNAAGTLQKQQDIYLESTAAHLQQLRTEAEKTYDILFDQDVINGFTDALTGTLNLFNSFIDSFGGGVDSIVALGGVVANVFHKQIGKAISGQIDNIQKLKNNTDAQKLKEQIITENQAKGNNISSNAVLDVQVQNTKKILDVQQQLTQEKANELIKLQEQIAIDQQRLEDIDQYKQIAKDLLGIQDAENMLHNGIKEKFDEEIEQKEEEIQLNKNSLKIYTDITNTKGAAFDTDEDRLATKKALFKMLNATTAEEQKNIDILTVKKKIAKEEKLTQEEIELIQKGQNRLGNERKEQLRQLQIGIKGVAAAESDVRQEIEEQMNARQRLFNEEISTAEQQASIENLVQGLTGLFSVVTSGKGAFEALSNSTLTTEEIFKQFGTTAIATIGLLISNFDSIKNIGKNTTGVLLNIFNTIKGTSHQSLKEVVASAGSWKALGKSIFGAKISLLGFKAALGPMALLIAGVTVAIMAGVKAYNKKRDAMLEEQKALEKTKEAYQKTKEEYDKLISSLEEYNGARNAIDSLKEGTIEWSQAVEELNQKVLELMSLYPELAQYVTVGENGIMELNQQGQDYIKQQQLLKTQIALQTQYQQQTVTNKATEEAKIEDIARNNNFLTEDIIQDFLNNTQGISTKSTDQEIIDFLTKVSENKGGTWGDITDEAKAETVKQLRQNSSNFNDIYNLRKSGNIAQQQLTTSIMSSSDLFSNVDSNILTALAKKNQDKINKQIEIEKESLNLKSAEDYAKAAGMSGESFSFDNKTQEVIAKNNTGEEIARISKEAVEEAEAMRKAIQTVYADTAQLEIESIANLKSKADNLYKGLGDYMSSFMGGSAGSFVGATGAELQDIQKALGNFDWSKENAEAYGFNDEERFRNQVEQNLQQAIDNLDGIALAKSMIDSAAITSEIQGVLSKGSRADLDEKQLAHLNQLEAKYQELGAIKNKDSHEYLQMLRQIQEIEEDNARKELEIQREKDLEKAKKLEKEIEEKRRQQGLLNEDGQERFNELEIEIIAKTEELESTLDNIKDNYAQMQIAIEADLKTDVDDAFGLADEFGKLQDLIPESLKISLEDAQKIIADGYGEILQQSKGVGENQIQLDKEVLNQFIDNRQKELDAAKQSKIEQLNLEKAAIQTQLNLLIAKEKILRAASQTDSAEDYKKYMEEAKRIDEQYQAEVSRLDALLSQEENFSTGKEEINAELYNDLASMYKTNSENQQAADDATTNNDSENTSVRLQNAQKLIQAYEAVGRSHEYANTGNPMYSMGLNYKVDANAITTSTTQSVGSTAVSSSQNQAQTEVSTESIYSDIIKNWQTKKEEYQATAAAAADATQDEIDYWNQMIGNLDAGISALQSAGVSLDKAQKNAGSKSGQDKKEQKKAEDEIDRYWELNKAIENVEESLSDLDKKQDKLYGKELVASLKEENQLLAQQADRYRALAAAQQQEAAELRGLLSSYGVVFDAQGGVANYLAATQAALETYNQAVAAYNAFLIDEATFKAAERAYENFKSTLARYETLYYQEMVDTQNKLEEIHRQELENNLKAWEVEIQLKLDMKELERQWDDFFKDINKNFKLLYEDLDATMSNLVEKATTYQGGDGDIATIISGIKDVTAEIDKMKSGGESGMFESISQAQEKLKELNDQLQDSALAMRGLWEEAWETYLEGIDQAADKLDDLMERYDDINEEIEYQKKLIELLYGDEAYELMDKYYDAQEQNTKAEIDSLKQQADLWKAQYEQALAIDEANGTLSQDTQRFYELWQDAQQGLNDKVVDYIELLQNDYKNTISDIISDLEKSISGGAALDDVKEQWELLKQQSEKYYDDVERIYELSSLASKYENSIINTSNLKNQQKLQEMYNQEMEYLQNKKNLNEYDLQVANAKYDMTLKQIMLEEAQQNKNSMKLTRGADGNWTYQYVADEDDIASKQQALLDATQQYYQITKEGYHTNLEDMMTAQATYLEKLQEINEKYMNDETERAARAQELYEVYYGEEGILTLLYMENETARTNMADSTLQSILNFYAIDEENYALMTETEQELIDGLRDGTITNYEQMLEKAVQVCEDTLSSWESSAQGIADAWYADNGASVKASMLQAYKDLTKANSDYQKAVNDLEKSVERDFGPEGIEGSLNTAINKTNELDNETSELCNHAESNLARYRDAINNIGNAWESVKDQIRSAISLVQQYLAAVGAANAASMSNISSGSLGSNLINNTLDKDKDKDKNKTPSIVTEVSWTRTNGAYYIYQSDGTYKHADASAANQGLPYAPYDSNIKKHFNTGGYTGEWANGDNDGRLAWLHQKELILNSSDTENILSAVNTARNLANLGSSINDSIMNGIGNMILSLMNLGNYNKGYNIGTGVENQETVFNINANFPNANEVESIREAIMSLPNLASQYIARNKK